MIERNEKETTRKTRKNEKKKHPTKKKTLTNKCKQNY